MTRDIVGSRLLDMRDAWCSVADLVIQHDQSPKERAYEFELRRGVGERIVTRPQIPSSRRQGSSHNR